VQGGRVSKYIILALVVALLVVGWLYRNDHKELANTQAALSVAQAVNDANAKEVQRLEKSVETTDKVLSSWNKDRTTLAGVRNAAQQAIKEAVRAQDQSFRVWADTPAHPVAWSLLNENYPVGANANYSAHSPGGAPGGLPGNTNTAKRQ